MHKTNIVLYHFTKAETLDKILASGWVRLTATTNTNDPFEGFIQRCYDNPNTSPELREMCEDMGKCTRDEPPLIISLSTMISSPSMWAHYADEHRGVCLAFEIPVYFYDSNDIVDSRDWDSARAIVPLIYSEEMPSLNDACGNDDISKYQSIFRMAGIYKGAEWKYEHEVRIIVANALLSPEKHKDIEWLDGWPYFNGLMGYLKSVVLGVRCTKRKTWVECSLQAHGYQGVSVVNAQTSATHYRIVTPETEGISLKDSCEMAKTIMMFHESDGQGRLVDRMWFMRPLSGQKKSNT